MIAVPFFIIQKCSLSSSGHLYVGLSSQSSAATSSEAMGLNINNKKDKLFETNKETGFSSERGEEKKEKRGKRMWSDK